MTNHNSPCVFEEVMSCVRVFCGSRANAENIDCEQSLIRQRAVSYFSLQSYCTRNLSTRAAKPRAARNERVSLVWSQSLIVIITSWFAIALDEIRTRRILREKGGLQAVYGKYGGRCVEERVGSFRVGKTQQASRGSLATSRLNQRAMFS